ncbi:Zn-dependent peptidase ImmA (M78 family) [Weissella uvarum]|uniref:ImmA/IrrE family metallo-endopeptidase n=1 Tax=Weissella uvarum TaxID=1479233 RepID=UPI00196227D2|nr:ImmA/IrrE family metallo-endopeptidase [Weissella uvarum]MBM7617316.1 Zn-dependent peptidase ImmA (M78 family) [Weissella uvarum]MCM0595183.1 hypothetical protein [Weissella uvarum]
MHEELFKQLLYIATQSDIIIKEVAGQATDPDVAFCKQRIINLNHNYQSSISVAFRLAHEICHIKFSQPTFLYTFSPYIKNKEERETNERAIRMLARLIYADTPNEYRNWSDFMAEFCLPSWFEPLVQDIIYD